MKKVLFKSIIFAIAIHFAFAGNIRADGFRENNIQKATEQFGTQNAGINPGGNPNGGQIPISATEEEMSPVGAGWEILGGLGLAYGFYLFLRKKRRQENSA